MKAAITSSKNSLLGSLARAQEEGKISNQDKERIEEELEAFSDPTAFFKDSQTAAAAIQGIRTNTLNRRQSMLTQLGAVDRDYVLTIPPTGTTSNPFNLGGRFGSAQQDAYFPPEHRRKTQRSKRGH